MKLFRLLFSALFLMTAAACGDDNPGKDSGGSGGREIEYDPAEGFKYVQHVNVQNARMIYRKQPSSRADGDTGYWKIDLSGNETKLVITDSDGKDHDIGINKIVKLSDRFLIIDPDAFQIIDLLVNPGPDDIISMNLFQYLSIVDTRTGKMYKWPRELFRMLGTDYDWNLSSAADDAENVYFSMRSPFTDSYERSALYKLDATSFTIASLLPEGEFFTDFQVTDEGFVIYWHRHSDRYRVKCPGGRIVPLTGSGFCLGNTVYTVDERKAFRWETVGDNDLTRTEVCSAEMLAYDVPLLTDALRHRVLFESMTPQMPPEGCFWAVAFDGSAFSEPVALPDRFRNDGIRNPDVLVTSEAWYLRSGNTLHKLAMGTYAYKQIAVSDYEIRKIVANPAEPDLHFTGYRYADGKTVVGTLTAADEVVVETVADAGSILELIALN